MERRKHPWDIFTLIVLFGTVLFLQNASIANEKGSSMEIGTGDTVQLEYVLKLNDGTIVDQSTDAPLQYIHGQGQMIPGLEAALTGMTAGEEKDVVVVPEQAYGPINPSAVQQVSRAQLPAEIKPAVGMQLQGSNAEGKPVVGIVKQVSDDSITVDFNHPLAGQTLNFHVKIVDIQKNA